MILKILGTSTLILALFVLVAWRIHATARNERTFNARVEEVWKVWNDEDSIKKWWGPKNYTAPIIRNDVRVSGNYLWSMKSPKGEMFWNTGVYKEGVPNKRIVSSMSFSDENGKAIPGSEVRVPGKWPNEITIIVEFSESDGKTRVTVTEVGVPLIVTVLSRLGGLNNLTSFKHCCEDRWREASVSLKASATCRRLLSINRVLASDRGLSINATLTVFNDSRLTKRSTGKVPPWWNYET